MIKVRGIIQFRVTYDLKGDMDLRQGSNNNTEKDQEIIIKKILIGFDESDNREKMLVIMNSVNRKNSIAR